MALQYIKMKRSPNIFCRLFGVSVVEFEKILLKVKPEWQRRILARYKRPGRPYKLDLADMILLLLLYYRSYITQIFVGHLFNIDDSRVCRIIQKLEPILAKKMALSKRKRLTQEEMESLIIDATEQALERPEKKQKKYYSGKKKRHTLKTELRVNLKGRIVHVSKSYPGSVHDFSVFKKGTPLPFGSKAYADSGYQGIHQLHPKTKIPHKASRNNPLKKEEKRQNKALSRLRIKVEHVIREIKTFKILSYPYRNKTKRYNLKFNIISGIVNLKNGFMAA